MRARLVSVLAAGCSLLLTTSPVLAHHFFPVESLETISLVGKVTMFEWVNPHARLFVDVEDEAGNVSNWEIELGSPGALDRRGWKIDSLKFGDEIRLEVLLGKGKTNTAIAREAVFPDGSKYFAGSHAGDPPPEPRQGSLLDSGIRDRAPGLR